MKRSLAPMTITWSLVCLLAVTGCQKTVNQRHIESQIVGKWTMVTAIGSYTDYGVNHKDTTFFTSTDYFEFKADSTLSIMVNEVAYNGKWKIDNDRLYITETHYMDFNGGFDLPILDQHNLQIHDTTSTSATTADQKLNLNR